MREIEKLLGGGDHVAHVYRASLIADTARLGCEDDLDSILQRLAPLEAGMLQPKVVPPGGRHLEGWFKDFLVDVAAACFAIDGIDDANGVEASYVPDKDMDTTAASVVYLSAWQVQGRQVGEEYVHWAMFGQTGQPPPRTRRHAGWTHTWLPRR